MPGFLGEISSKKVFKNFGHNWKKDLIVDKFEDKKYYIERRTINKFLDDKIFYNGEKYLIVTEGVILNKKKLIEKYKEEDFLKTLIKMYLLNGETFFNEFRGSFCGLLYDKGKDTWLIYTNHYGDKQIFYSDVNEETYNFIFGSEINYLLEYMKNNDITYNFDINGAYFLLTYGYMIEDYTLFKEIKKLKAGHYIKIVDNKFEIIQYYKLNNEPDSDQTIDEIIENVDNLFRNAIELEFEKDKEYGYKHISSLSGGLDSRMVTWVAHEMGYRDMLNYCFSQSDYLDERISKKIASDLKHDYVFKALDNGIYLEDIESMIKVNFGNGLYIGSAHGKSFVDLIKWDKYGLVHTGQLGDVILGTYYTSNKENKPFQIGDGGYSKKLVERLKSINLKEKYENQEIFNFYNRGFNGIMQGNLPSQDYTEVASPFLDVDFMNYCLKIPLKYRWNHFIYFEWIKRKYPKAGNYKWERINAKISDIKINILGRQVALMNLPRKITKKVIKKISGKNGISLGESMNPVDYWYESNKSLRDFFFRVYDNDMVIFDADINLKKDLKHLFNYGNVIEKTQVLTLLEAYRIFFKQ